MSAAPATASTIAGSASIEACVASS